MILNSQMSHITPLVLNSYREQIGLKVEVENRFINVDQRGDHVLRHKLLNCLGIERFIATLVISDK